MSLGLTLIVLTSSGAWVSLGFSVPQAVNSARAARRVVHIVVLSMAVRHRDRQ
jgi:hypothetical protein